MACCKRREQYRKEMAAYEVEVQSTYRYNQECGECIKRMATQEEIEEIIKKAR